VTRQALVRAIADLPEREKLMMALYYEQDLNLREIGEVMGVSESRVCQLHSQAVMRLRTRLAGAVDKKRKKIEKNG
jgi:RNA polymerase sigma factor for flagellar operon FliA